MSTVEAGAVETEALGVDYERYALDRSFRRLVRRHTIGSVLEIPAKGQKAMPSLYSLGFAGAGCDVALVNPEPKSLPAWASLGYGVECHRCEHSERTGLPAANYDLTWNFLTLAQAADAGALLAEMVRLSRRYVMFLSVNRFNPGFFAHRLAHRVSGIEWTHGAIEWMNPFRVRRFFECAGLEVVETGLVDTPPFPDSLGFRDLRLHRLGVDLDKHDWYSRTVEWMRTGRYPRYIRALYMFESVPVPFLAKLGYAHLFYVLGRRSDPGS